MATFLRNDAEWKDRIVYWGPMGCLTGCYLIIKGALAGREMQPLMLRAFEHMRDYEGAVPGATAVNCGNYLLHDLPMAKWEAAKFVEVLKSSARYEYETTKRLETGAGAFYDS